MSVYKRKFGTETKWCVYITFPNGKRRRKVVGTKKQAEEVHRKLKNELVEGRWDLWENEDVPFSDLAIEYMEYSKANKAASTSTVNKYRIRAHLLPYFGDRLLSRITPQMVDGYKVMRIGEAASPNTVNRELANLSHMPRMAVRWRYVDKNVVSSVDKMKVPERPRRFLRQAEIRRLEEAARGSYPYPMIVTALHTGMRKSELLNLKWSDIDFDRRTATVQAKADWHTKNYRSRTLQLTPMLHRVLGEHKKLQAQLGFQSEYVFTHRGARITYGIDASLREVVKEAGLSNITLHTFRHTFASQLVMAGVSLRGVQELMGHKSFETTLQYAHLSEEHVKRQVLKLPFANG